MRTGSMAALFAATVALFVALGTAGSSTNPGNGAEIKDNVIVPCLLPARVRRLGGIVYPARRQLIQTTATKCELQGGEYTSYDRAKPDSAVAFFKPLAEEGELFVTANQRPRLRREPRGHA